MNEHHKNQSIDSVIWLGENHSIQIMGIKPNYFDPFGCSTGIFRIIELFRIKKIKSVDDLVEQTVRMLTPDYNIYEPLE